MREHWQRSGVASPPAPATPVPTLNEWGLILLSLVLAGAGLVYMKKRRRYALAENVEVIPFIESIKVQAASA
ncbi:MAG: IPTL-CTERM sorting domain-containing protein [Pseudomonadota bacterium]